tara:strand:- start:929 stop:3259 length:2331 start_codon:yes stop_codon:yes gene_type:complete
MRTIPQKHESSIRMALSSNLGYPRIGPNRELKRALERYWSGRNPESDLIATAASLRSNNWLLQKDAGLDHIPSNDFSFYDQVLDMASMLGAIPDRFQALAGNPLDKYFAMARGYQYGTETSGIPAMEMTKWFDTNYHYIVPEFDENTRFEANPKKPLSQFLEAEQLGIATRPVLLGPITFLMAGKPMQPNFSPLDLLERLLPEYVQVIKQLEQAGAAWIQIDEPYLVMDLDERTQHAYKTAYDYIGASTQVNKLLTSYFGDLRENLSLTNELSVEGLHIDLVRSPDQATQVATEVSHNRWLSLGLIDGRNIWKTDLTRAIATAESIATHRGNERLFIGPSCSLLHSPVDLELETSMEPELKDWLSFAAQKLDEIKIVCQAINSGRDSVADYLAQNTLSLSTRSSSTRIHNPDVKKRLAAVEESMLDRKSPYHLRAEAQQQKLELPDFPTTTIGSFPQTSAVRKARSAFKRGNSTTEEYQSFLREEIRNTIAIQNDLGLDVLVHGESERTDMVEYFGEQMEGIAFTSNGWVQSYGSRCVRPPVIFGDVSRPEPMTVDWTVYAQSLSDKPVKGMLTGPVTILQWSFVRDDQPRSDTCYQIAMAIRDEVSDLEKAGIGIIQIDEPAIREGLPLRESDWNSYLEWAVGSFRLAASAVADETQIHTHMCYAEFNDIINAIAAMDADVISIESSRSRMELLDAFLEFNYPNAIGPGVWDIHSPRIPETAEMSDLLARALKVIPPNQLWVNPDCGLKTRNWEEVKPALRHMVAAARKLRTNDC